MDRRHNARRAMLLAAGMIALGGCQQSPTIGKLLKDGGRDAGDGTSAGGWVISAGGPGSDGKLGQIVVDGAGDLVVTGPFSGNATFGGRTLTATRATGRYVAKLRADDHELVWVVPIQGDLQVEHTSGLATDDAGNIYLSGSFSGSASFGDAGSGSITRVSKGETDIFVAKLAATGKPIWAVSAGGPGSGPLATDFANHAYRVAVDKGTGQVVAAGAFRGTISFGDTTLTASGMTDIFVARLDAGGRFLWARRPDSDAPREGALGLTIDPTGSSFVTGHIISWSTPVATFGDLTPQTGLGLFVTKMDAAGRFLWATLPPSSPTCGGHDIALDSEGNTYAALNVGAANGGSCVLGLAAKVDPGGKPLWLRTTGGSDPCRAGSMTHKLVVDSAGHATLCGAFSGSQQLGAKLFTAQGDQDMFLAGLDPQGKVVWARQAGGPGTDMATSLARDREGNLYVAGSFEQTADFGGVRLTSQGESDLFIWKIPAAVQ